MSSTQPGSLSVQGPYLRTQTITVSPSTCQDLSVFKDILKEYRKLDDTIVMRLNRANANMRDKDRIQGLSGNASLQDQACESIWRELVANWKRRTQLVDYCVSVVDKSITDKRSAIDDQADDPRTQRKIQAQIYEDQVMRNQVHRELSVEDIVRKRSADAFRSRCQYFIPPMTDAEARKMWDAAQK
ncbi:caffeine-induced death protein 2-domain-containing protein [Pholiota molesta]|nr:caffeine-induced death protein 2-domain-containing protein [Pholiota molesta]